MRLIDADALTHELNNCHYPGAPYVDAGISIAIGKVCDAPTIEPERKKDTIQKFHDYQVEWLLAHCDLELEPQLEEWVVRFLHDTANCYMMEIDRAEGEQE